MLTFRGMTMRAVVSLALFGALALGVGVSAAAAVTQHISLNPTSGKAGSTTVVTGSGFGASESVGIWFVNHNGGTTTKKMIGTATADATGGFSKSVIVPSAATVGLQTIRAQGATSHLIAFATFDVTP
jgi:hypothetical protein